MLEYTLENYYISEGYNVVCGVDEAGRGPLAGPVVAAACVLPCGLVIDGLNDSKKLTEKKRDMLFDIIKENAFAYSIASASPEEIDKFNILNADMVAMGRAITGLSVKPDCALIDGNIARGFNIYAVPIVKGDAISPSIAAASILAKVTRDRLMIEYDKQYPQYGFAKHKGYPTKEHREAVIKFGACEIHRKTFLGFVNKTI